MRSRLDCDVVIGALEGLMSTILQNVIRAPKQRAVLSTSIT